jgi:hypothetical protein
VDKRFNWLKRHLIEFEERHGPIFPPDWEMSERIAAEFCRVTRGDFTRLLGKRRQVHKIKGLGWKFCDFETFFKVFVEYVFKNKLVNPPPQLLYTVR